MARKAVDVVGTGFGEIPRRHIRFANRIYNTNMQYTLEEQALQKTKK